MADFGKTRGTGGPRTVDFSASFVVFSSATRRFSRDGQLFTGIVDKLCIYNKQVIGDATAVLQAQADNVNIINGELTLTEGDLSYGSLTGLDINTDYWFYLINTNLTVISIGIIRPQ